MKKIIDSLGVLGVVLGIVTAIYVIYHESFEEKNPVISLTVVSTSHPTAVSKVDGLSASYKFKNRNVSNLWIEDLQIYNKGNVTLIGKGNQKNIIDDSLCFYIRRPFHFLNEMQVIGDCGDITYYLANDTTISIKFIQWRPKEQLDFKLYIEGDTSSVIGPTFFMNDRQVMNGIVQYQSANASNNNVLIKDAIKSENIANLAGMMGGILSVLYLGLFPFLLFDLIKTFVLYNSWYRKNYDSYESKVKELVEEGKLKKFVNPSGLPSYYWEIIEIDKVNAGTVESVKDLIGVSILLFMMAWGAAGGIMWMIPKFW